MRLHGWLVMLLAAGLWCACDSGGDGGEEGEPDLVEQADEGGGGPNIQCSKTSSCPWGQSCQNHQCVIPEGQNPAKTAFDFEKLDECPGSPTSGQTVALSDFHGSVILLYFSTTTCDACKADVQVYEGMVQQLEAKGFVGAGKMMTVILPMSASALPDFAGPLETPVVVDDTTTGIADHYSAGKDTVVLIDKAGYIRESFPKLEVRGAAADKSMLNQLLTEMAAEKL